MDRVGWAFAVAVIVTLSTGAAACGEAISTTRPAAPAATPSTETVVAASRSPAAQPDRRDAFADVVRVIDGDTIEVRVDGQLLKVRYIGIDTPELNHPQRGEEPHAGEATEANRVLVLASIIARQDI